MGDKVRVAIFPCGSEAGLEVFNALRHEKHIELFGASSVPCHGQAVFRNYFNKLPYISAPDFLERFNAYLTENQISHIFPAYDDILLYLSAHRENLAAELIAPSHRVCEISRSKRLTYEALAGLGFCPAHYAHVADIEAWPVFVKPDRGQGAQGARRVDSAKEALALGYDDPSYILCENLPGPEYTVDCFTDRHGGLRYTGMRERLRTKSGISMRTRTMPAPPELREIAKEIQARIAFRGVWFFQVKQDAAGQLKLLEVAPRVAGSMAANRVLGVNFPALSLYDHMGCEVAVTVNPGEITLERSLANRYLNIAPFNRVYIDYDDTILCDGRINLVTVQFLYNCANTGRALVLLTRHAGDIHKSLQSHHLPESLFEGIVHLTDQSPKSDHIDPEGAIFVDDAYSERAEVAKRHGIPVYSVDALESLIDWRER